MVPLSKSGVRKHRGFESRPLRQPRTSSDRPDPGRSCCLGERSPSGLWRRTGNAVRGNPSRVRIPPSPPHPHAATPADAVRVVRSRDVPWRGDRVGDRPRRPDRVSRYPSSAVLGGELAVPCSLQSAPAGLNPLSRSPFSVAARRCDVEDRVPRSDGPRTVSDPEGSSTKRPSSGAAERPGPSRPSRWARGRVDRRRVHGTSHPSALDRRRS
jgi:hypothetical protein